MARRSPSDSTARSRALVPSLAVIAAASLWSTLGISYEILLHGGGTDRVTMVTLRLTIAALVVLAYALMRRPEALRVPRAARASLLGTGVVSFGVFYVALIYAFHWSSVPVATVLLYTAPAWVALGEHLFLGYRMTRTATIALGATLLGAVLVADILRGTGELTLKGIAAGLFSAVTYSSMSLFGKRAMESVPPLTVMVYGMGIGALCLIPVKLLVSGPTLPEPGLLLRIALWPALAVTVVPVALYTWGLSMLRPSTASILATVEPVFAIALAWLILDQHLHPAQIVGAALVLGAAVYLSLNPSSGACTKTPAGFGTGGR